MRLEDTGGELHLDDHNPLGATRDELTWEEDFFVLEKNGGCACSIHHSRASAARWILASGHRDRYVIVKI